MLVIGAPDPHGAGDISRGNPLAVGGVPGDGGGVGMLSVDSDVEGVVEVEDDDGSAVGVEDVAGLGVAGDEYPPAPLRGRHAGVGLRELRRHRSGTRGSDLVRG